MMRIFYSDTHNLHFPPFEVFDGGVRVPYLESPDRAHRVLTALQQTGWAEISAPMEFGMEPVRAVHDPGYLNFLASAWDEWVSAEPAPLTDGDRAALLPATFALRMQVQPPASLLGRAGYYMMDLSAPIVEGTYRAALASVDCGLSAAQAILNGEHSSFALTRPPGHHAGRANCGGYCYLNNAAVTANWLSRDGKVAILDIDYHAGNGTQEIFFDRPDVLTISIHADPSEEYPYFSGHAAERGTGAGEGFHHNFPLSAGTGDSAYLGVLDHALALIREYSPRWLLISAGMDIYDSDPLGRIKVTTPGIREIGRRIAILGIPAAIMMEGGYNNKDLGLNFVTFLEAFR